LRAARSTDQVETYEAGRTELLRDGKPAVGSFTVSAGELVYVGHFGKECIDGRPTLWRYYIAGRKGFRWYLETNVDPKCPFLDTENVRYRLFRTKVIGHDYDLP
jgi:hypothetical protein